MFIKCWTTREFKDVVLINSDFIYSLTKKGEIENWYEIKILNVVDTYYSTVDEIEHLIQENNDYSSPKCTARSKK